MIKIRGFELVSTYTNLDLLPKRGDSPRSRLRLKVARHFVIAPGENRPRSDWC